jgi:esterase
MELNFKMYGNPLNEELLILHGLFGTLDNWQTVAKVLSEHFCVYTLDMRNHGRSAHTDLFNYELMAADVVQFIDEKGLRQPHIIGHSMGGKVAMTLAVNYPDYLYKMVVVDIAPKVYKAHHQEVFKAMFAIPVDTLPSRAEAEIILNRHDLDWATKQFILKNLSISKETSRYEWRVNLNSIYQHYTEILSHNLQNKSYKGEVLFIKGELSNYINVEELELYRQFFPRAELQTIADAGHWIHADKPNEFLKICLDWLNS